MCEIICAVVFRRPSGFLLRQRSSSGGKRRFYSSSNGDRYSLCLFSVGRHFYRAHNEAAIAAVIVQPLIAHRALIGVAPLAPGPGKLRSLIICRSMIRRHHSAPALPCPRIFKWPRLPRAKPAGRGYRNTQGSVRPPFCEILSFNPMQRRDGLRKSARQWSISRLISGA